MSDDPQSGERQRPSILRNDPAVAFDRWEMPEFEANQGQTSIAPGISVSQLEAVQKQAYEEAYALGMQEGQAAGAAESRAETQRLHALFTQLAQPFEELDECVERQVVQLAMIVARNIIRRELKTDPSHVIGAVREALAALPITARDVCVKLHPEDAAIVRKFLKPVEGEQAWRLEEDPVLTRGGCRVQTEHSHVDASIESRLSALVAAMIGDERAPAETPRSRQDPS